MDLDALMRFWTDLLGLTPQNGWKVTWGWVDDIPRPNGGSAVGLNQTNSETLESHISIRRPRSQAELADLDDTCAHETVHCLGRRMQYLLDAGREVDAHEYLAETLAPAMVKIKGTPKAKYLAKAARTLPARAKGTPKMDVKALLAMLAMVMAASTPEEKEKLLNEMKAQLEANAGGDAASPASDAAPAAAKPPEEKPADALPSNDAGMRNEEALQKSPAFAKQMASAVDAILEAREGLSDAAKSFAKTLGLPDKVRAYLKTIPPKPQEVAKPLEQLGADKAPRGGNGGTSSAPSGDAKVNALFRILPTDDSSDGIATGEPGKLLSMSVVRAYPKIRKATNEMVAGQKVKMLGGAQ